MNAAGIRAAEGTLVVQTNAAKLCICECSVDCTLKAGQPVE